MIQTDEARDNTIKLFNELIDILQDPANYESIEPNKLRFTIPESLEHFKDHNMLYPLVNIYTRLSCAMRHCMTIYNADCERRGREIIIPDFADYWIQDKNLDRYFTVERHDECPVEVFRGMFPTLAELMK